MSTQLKTLAMKARLANKIRKTLYKRKLDQISDNEKVAIFNDIYAENHLMHWELISYKQKRKKKKAIYDERVKRGYKFKKKTTKEEFEKSKKINLEN